MNNKQRYKQTYKILDLHNSFRGRLDNLIQIVDNVIGIVARKPTVHNIVAADVIYILSVTAPVNGSKARYTSLTGLEIGVQRIAILQGH